MPSTIRAPRIYTCKEWKARPVPLNALHMVPPRGVVIHHTTNPQANSSSLDLAFQSARSMQAQHMDANGWADTGQHLTLASGGAVLEGRHGTFEGLRKNVIPQGAHAGDPEGNQMIGIECEGYFHDDDTGRFHAMSDLQWNALVDLCAWLVLTQVIGINDIVGHREFGGTACPGSWLFARLPQIRKEVAARVAGGDPGAGTGSGGGTGGASPDLVVKVQTAGGFTLIDCNPVNERGKIRGDVAAIARALGWETRWVPPGRVELFKPEPKPAAAVDAAPTKGSDK